MAAKIHDLINQERAAAGFSPLGWDDALSEVAARHSRDQATDNIELTDPEKLCNYPIIRHEGFVSGFTLKERFENANVDYRAGGEYRDGAAGREARLSIPFGRSAGGLSAGRQVFTQGKARAKKGRPCIAPRCPSRSRRRETPAGLNG